MAFEAVGISQTIACNSGTLSYPIEFQFQHAGDILAWRHSDAEFDPATSDALELGVDYTISGDGTAMGGALVPITPFADGYLTIERHSSRDQTADYTPNDAFPAESHEAQLDRLSMVDEEQQTAIDASPQLARGQSFPNPVIPPLASANGMTLVWDAPSNRFKWEPNIAYEVTEEMQEILDQANLARDQANASANAAAASAVQSGNYANQSLLYSQNSAASAAASENSRIASAASATQSANSAGMAQAAAATIGAYPNAAATYVPQGLTQAGVGALTPGSGGAPGTYFDGTWTGGNFAVNPTFSYTINAGGQLSAFTITGTGLYFGNAGVVPTPVFGHGLVGAAVARTIQYLVGNGQFYWAQSADGQSLIHYQNVGGVATIDNNTGPIPTMGAFAALGQTVATERAARLVRAVRSAVRDSSKIKLLVTKDGAKTYRSGSQTDIETLVPLIGPAGVNLIQPGNTWDGTGGAAGAPRRPIEVADGIQFGSQTGFDLNSGVVAGTAGVCIDFIISFPALTATAAAPAGTYPDVATMTADVANLYMGQMVKVIGGPLTNLSPDPPIEFAGWQNITANNFLRGFYLKGNGTMNLAGAALFFLYDTAFNGTSRFMYPFLDGFGRLHFYTYDGTVNPEVYTACTDIVTSGQAKPQHIRMLFDDTHIRVWVNGVEVMAVPTLTNFTPNKLNINGGIRAANNTIPFGGMSYTLNAMAVTQGLDFTEQRFVSDALARFCGTPIQPFHPEVYLFVQKGQSRGAGSGSTAGDQNRPDSISGWNGETVRANSRSASGPSFTQETLPRTYCCSSPDNPTDIGPVGTVVNAFGSPTAAGGSHTVAGTGGETNEWGMVNQLRLGPDGREFRERDIMIIGLNYGGWSLGSLDQKSVPPKYIYDLDAASGITQTQAREMLNRMVSKAVKFFAKRGQKLRLVGVYDEQCETLGPLPIDPATGAMYTQDKFGAAYEASARQWLPNELLKLASGTDERTPMYAKKAADYGADGASNAYSMTPYYYTDQLRKLWNNRDNIFRYMFLGESYAIGGRFIHWPPTTYRKLGERLGRRYREGWVTGKSDCFQINSAARNGSNQIVLTLNRAAVLVDSTPYPSVLQRHRTGGIDTYGFVLEASGGRTITNVDLSNMAAATPTITISVSGAGAIAGDRVNVTGLNALWGNIREATSKPGIYYDQDYSSLPGVATPIHALSANLNETAEFLCPSTHLV
ncbi:MAG TPA: hypothetical protein VFW22_16430 [Pseudolabrys sp.]|nr:hypothetical protein [Pseudolabrys sp.]